MSGNTTTTGQTHVHRQGASHERLARAAATRRRRDLARRLTAGKTEFVKSEPPLMRKNTDLYPTHQPGQSENRLALGTKTAAEQRGSVEHACAHKQQRTEQSRGECSPTLTPRQSQPGCRVASGWRVCTYVCVCRLSAFTLLAPLAMCASVHVCV